jgi:hypothetical protein
MKSSKPIVLNLVLSAGAVVAVAALAFTSKQVPDEVGALRAEVARIKARAEAPRVVVQATRTAPPAEAIAAAPVLPSGDETPEPKAPAPAKTEAEQTAFKEKFTRARLDLCEDTHVGERVDREWATRAEQTIRDTYAGAEFSSLHWTADCRATLCRLDFEYTDPAGAEAVRRIVAVHPWPGKSLTHLDQEAQRGSAYIVREGYALPQPELESLN